MHSYAATLALDVASIIDDHLTSVATLLSQVPVRAVAAAVAALEHTRRNEGTAFIMGNGGSSAAALHLASDLAATTTRQGPLLRTHCLNGNMSTFSALANDCGYANVFVGQLGGLRPCDLVLVISASGNSENCVRAVAHARALGARTVGLLGFDGGRLAQSCEVVVHVPRHDYLTVEDAHGVVCHAIARAMAPGPANVGE